MVRNRKSIKLTDIRANKPWLRKVGVHTYHTETRSKNKRFLIVCEGQTEALYFQAFPVLTAEVRAIPQGVSKTALIECTKSYLNDEIYEEIWCVFDMDYDPNIQGQSEDFNRAIIMGHESGFKCAYSNDAFELWFVLHYEFTSQEQPRHFYFEKLSHYWSISYERDGKKWKFAKQIFNLLETDSNASQENAEHFAEKLFREQQHKTFHLQNPVTTVFKLVRLLNKHLRR